MAPHTTLSFVAAMALVSLSLQACAAPKEDSSASTPPPAPGFSMALKKRAPARTPEEWGIWAKNHRAGLEAKYGNPHRSNEKRGTGTNLCVIIVRNSHSFLIFGFKGWSTRTLIQGTFSMDITSARG